MSTLSLRLYNTLTRQLEAFIPREPGRAGVYVCGPTVYDVPHAGHARAAVAFDVLVRHLRQAGLTVNYVRNVTDIDDKILNRAKANGESPLDLSRRMEAVYSNQMAEMGCLKPDHEPRVSDHLEEVLTLVKKLVAEGAAYDVEVAPGIRDVYFSVRSFPEYGKLSRRKVDDLLVGARVAREENKRDPLDFALWKGAAEEEWGWDSPWGRGRPGWHIECSAMSARYLGHGFDIHGGGMDLIFPHHENEIAQSEAARPGEGHFARYWLHNGFVNVDKEKMGKSLGNFVTVSDVLKRNDPEAFRWFLLSAQYRGPIQFETEQLEGGRVIFPGINDAEARVDYMVSTLGRLRELVGTGETAPAKLPNDLSDLRNQMVRSLADAKAALDDDLNTPGALAGISEIARVGNEVADLAQRRRKDKSYAGAASVVAGFAISALEALTRTLGLLQSPPEVYRARTTAQRLELRGLTAQDIEAKVLARTEARKAKDFAQSDALRDELAGAGIILRDAPWGTDWSVSP